MTYKELQDKLNSIPSERLNDTITVYDHGTGEYMGVEMLLVAGQDQDVLDEGHVYLTMNSNIVVIE
jgi:hypothetical protein